ncbi:MAG: cobalamin-dependent protein [Thermincola sp.]|nr:cobalamin-dependent protein [Thermincola sp.]MDT3701520.1 cobalamin-dependent protein [Thermincola sp.]
MRDDLINAMANLEDEKALALVREKIRNGETVLDVVEQCRNGVEIVGQRYHDGIYFLSDLIMSEAIFKEVMEIIEPYFPIKPDGIDEGNAPMIIMGTIEGDIHDLGKNIVIYILRAAGYRVYDLGVNVSAERFIDAIKETGASIVGVCVILNFCLEPIKKLTKLLVETGLRSRVTVVIGGYPVDEHVKDYTGADYYSNDAVNALDIFDKITGATRVISK